MKLPALFFLFQFFLPASSYALIDNDSLTLALLFQKATIETDSSTFFLQRADELYDRRPNSKKWRDNYLFLKARYYIQTGELKKGIETAQKGLAMHEPGNKSRSRFFNLIGAANGLMSEYKKAIEAYSKALVLLENNGEQLQAAYVRNNIANTFFSLMDYRSAYNYAKEAYTVSAKFNDTIYMPAIAGILAVSEIKTGRSKAGYEHVKVCLKLAEKYKQPLGLIVGNYGLGEYYLNQKNPKAAIEAFSKALTMSVQFRQKHYALLCKIGMLTANNAAGEFHEAVKYGEEVLPEAQELHNTNTLYSIYRNLAHAYAEVGQSDRAYRLIHKAHTIYKDKTSRENRSQINRLMIRYETQKKERALTQSKLKLIRRNVLIAWLFAALSVILMIVLVVVYRNRLRLKRLDAVRNQQVLEALLEGEKKERRRLAQELHDGAASSLGGIQLLLSVEAKGNAQLEQLSERIRFVQEDVRRMAHNLIPLAISELGWSGALEQFCRENTHEQLKITCVQRIEGVQMENPVGQVIFRMIQELVHNCLRHAQAANCYVQAIAVDGGVLFSVEDDGIGMTETQFNGTQGLKTIQERLLWLESELEVESSPGKGTLFRFFIASESIK